MAANPRRETPQPQPHQAHHLTFAPASSALALSDKSQISVRNVCWHCHGKRTLDTIGYARCDVCGRAHKGDTLPNEWLLPCGHSPKAGGKIKMRYEPCEICGGEDGYLYRWIALDPLIDFALHWIAENYEQYETISQAITARQRVP